MRPNGLRPRSAWLSLCICCLSMLLGTAALARVPQVVSISPNTGPNNTGMVISATVIGKAASFGGRETVKLQQAGQPDRAAQIVSRKPNTLVCTLDLRGAAAGLWDVVVTNSEGTGTLTKAFTITSMAPAALAIAPASAPNNGIVAITALTGAGFLPGAEVKLSRSGQADIPGEMVTVESLTQLRCAFNLSSKTVGAWDVVVTNHDGKSTKIARGFEILSAPQNGLSGLTVSNIARTTALVNWLTLLPSDTTIGYGTSPCASYDLYPNRGFGPGNMVYHSVALAGLEPETTYYLCARSGDAESGTVSFTTSSLRLPTLVYTGDTAGTTEKGGTVTLAATLTDDTGLADKTVALVCGGFSATATTDAKGVASVQVPAARLKPGTHPIACRFAGDEKYLPASATGSLTITGRQGHTLVRGTGYFYRDGLRSKRCTFDFCFDAALVTGWLVFNEAGIRKWVTVNVAKSIVLRPDPKTGPEATIVCGPHDEYTIVLNTATRAFSIKSSGYWASAERVVGEMVIEEEAGP